MKRIAYIDGLRAVAVLAVVAFHIGVHNAALVREPNSLVGMILRQGCHGVDLFFVLSGFCLSYPVLTRLRDGSSSTFNVVAYAARRLVRIIPPYYIAIAAVLVGGLVFGFGLNAFSPRDVLMQALFLDYGPKLINPSFWTLAVEFRWYFLFPVALWLWVRSPRAFLCVLVLILIATGLTQARSIDLWVLPAFMLGIPAADISIRAWPQRRYAPVAVLILLPIAILTTLHGTWTNSTNITWALAMFALVVAAESAMLMRQSLSARPLVALGVASYGVYLIHEPVLAFLEQRFVTTGIGPLAAIALACVLAGMAFSAVAERPFTVSRLRNSLVADTERVVFRTLRFCGVSGRLALPANGMLRAVREVVVAAPAVERDADVVAV